LATRSSNLLDDDAPKQRPDQPSRSLVAPVSDPDTGESASLLVPLPSKLSAKALAEAQSLEKLPPAHQLALRRALISVTESHKETETARVELARLKDRLQQAEKESKEHSRALVIQSALADAQVAGLRENLAALVSTNETSAAQSRNHLRLYVGLALGTVLLAVLLFALLRPHPESPAPSAELHPVPAQTAPQSLSAGKVLLVDPVVTPVDSAAKPALDRLERALGAVPQSDITMVIRAANQWLIDTGIPPCTVHMAEGRESLLVTVKPKTKMPLAASLARCAEAIEHVTE
jgi:hypothetical protein